MFHDLGPWGTRLLNVTSGLALMGAAAWFSYNLFAANDTNDAVRALLTETARVPGQIASPALTPGGELSPQPAPSPARP
jgi:hypothetical protein